MKQTPTETEVTALTTQAGEEFDVAFSELLATWQSHQELRASAVPTSELFASHVSLDRLRERMACLRARDLATHGTNKFAPSPEPALL
jgi:hypothetical protein